MEKIEIINLLKENINNNSLIKIVLSNLCNKQSEKNKIVYKPILLKNDYTIHSEFFIKNKAFHQNFQLDEFLITFEEELDNYKQFLITTKGFDFQILKNKKGYKLKKIQNNIKALSLEHNKKKNYIIEDGEKVPFLIKLGVMDCNGNVLKSRYDKFRQINKYLEFIDDTIKELETKKLIDNNVKIIDFGCGKSYLTFALHYYLSQKKKINFDIIGLDLKEDVMEHCNSISKELDCQNLKFLTGNIKDFDLLNNVDIIFSLHACDNATDYAILKGLELNAKAILSVPCCQHEFNHKISSNKNSNFFKYENPIAKHGILLEKFASLATDGFRASALELCGYKTQVMEFIDMEHTPKNILIKSIKDNFSPTQLENRYKELELFRNYLGISPLLDTLLKDYYLLKK